MNESIISSSIDNEIMVLGTMLNNLEHTSTALGLVHEDDFVELKHKNILKAIRSVFQEKKSVDTHLIGEKLKMEGHSESVGGIGYLMTIAQYAGTSCHIEAYCKDLKKLTTRRQLISYNNSLSHDLTQGVDESKIIEKLKEKIESIEKHKVYAESSFRHLLENNSEKSLIKELKEISEGISTGFTIGNIDLVIPGGAITIVAAPTSHGKTATLVNFSLGALKLHPNKNIYFFTYEESGASILCLFLNTWIGKELSRNNRESIKSHFRKENVEHINTEMRAAFLSDKQAFFENLIDTGRLKVFYSDMSTEELISAIKFIKANDPNIGMICIDYMQFLKLQRFQGSRQEELKQICMRLKDCAVDTGLPIMLAAQFNRTVVAEADLSPTNIGEAGDIERAANIIIGMWNRNFNGFSREGNVDKNKNKISKEPAIYFELMKGRGIEPGQSSVMDFNGNTGVIENRINPSKTNSKNISPFG